MSTYVELSDGEGRLAFCRHLGGQTATFDVTGTDATLTEQRSAVGGLVPAICNNLTREGAAQLREALDAWLSDGAP